MGTLRPPGLHWENDVTPIIITTYAVISDTGFCRYSFGLFQDSVRGVVKFDRSDSAVLVREKVQNQIRHIFSCCSNRILQH